ncbi:hypothetical protein L6R44_08465 [Enterobacter cloacae complex sp. ECC445]|uniref:hypothetical protein n=1 Tax=Enterobacter cloacae complex sp. ECC445 TaxID=2913213 RepID=UPI001F167590|nr:hypothetical protein [Enterobacter cloacae complex sp. ECC445]MCG0456131.1 hypothetical protein [Enterobacter cloacae complex sp. ECC445]
MNDIPQEKNIHIATRLADDAFNSPYFKEVYTYIVELYNNQLFDNNFSIELRDNLRLQHALRFADILSNSNKEEYRTSAFEIVSKMSSLVNDDAYFKFISLAVINRLGIYAAEKLISEETILPLDREIDSAIKKSIQQTDLDGVYFTDKQYDLYQLLKRSSTISFAGPTSMGKSFVINAYIKEIVAKSDHKNIALIVPTRALISQNALKLKMI